MNPPTTVTRNWAHAMNNERLANDLRGRTAEERVALLIEAAERLENHGERTSGH
jgi:hypothetical protein